MEDRELFYYAEANDIWEGILSLAQGEWHRCSEADAWVPAMKALRLAQRPDL
jgi:hypothetical protein